MNSAQRVAQLQDELDGEIEYGARVSEILVEDGAAVGVRLADGSERRADFIISATDGRTTIFDLLGGRYADDAIRKHYADLPVAESIVQVSIGVRRDFSDLPPMLDSPLNQPIDMGGVSHDRLVLKHYCFDPTVADAGKSSLTVWAEADYDHWRELHEAAAHFAREHELMWAMWDLVGGIGREEKQIRALAQPVVRRRIAPIIHEACDHDIAAALCIEQALAMPKWRCQSGDAKVAMPKWRCQSGDAKVAMPKWRCQSGDAKVAMPKLW